MAMNGDNNKDVWAGRVANCDRDDVQLLTLDTDDQHSKVLHFSKLIQRDQHELPLTVTWTERELRASDAREIKSVVAFFPLSSLPYLHHILGCIRTLNFTTHTYTRTLGGHTYLCISA
jgi:hypothetical protein